MHTTFSPIQNVGANMIRYAEHKVTMERPIRVPQPTSLRTLQTCLLVIVTTTHSRQTQTPTQMQMHLVKLRDQMLKAYSAMYLKK